MQRDPTSHKGDNGKVAIIGGSMHQHGAPIFSALAAEASGADLIYLSLPRLHADIAKTYGLNLQIHPFHGDDLSLKDVDMLLELLATVDCAVIGPGLARTQESIKAIEELVTGAACALVLDATALQPNTFDLIGAKPVVLTPHLGELERMQIDEDLILQKIGDSPTVLLLKDEVDTVFASAGTHEVVGGNAGLTVGGTGDSLAGIIAGLIAQDTDPFDACVMASTVIKRAGDELFEDFGYAYGTERVIGQIPYFLHNL